MPGREGMSFEVFKRDRWTVTELERYFRILERYRHDGLPDSGPGPMDFTIFKDNSWTNDELEGYLYLRSYFKDPENYDESVSDTMENPMEKAGFMTFWDYKDHYLVDEWSYDKLKDYLVGIENGSSPSDVYMKQRLERAR